MSDFGYDYEPDAWAMQQMIMPEMPMYPQYTPAPGYGYPSDYGAPPMGMQPQIDPLLWQMFMSMIQPSLTSKGALEPYDVDYQGKMRNAQQDIYSSLADPVNTLIAGMGGMDPGALDPIIERTEIQMPKSGALGVMAELGGFEGTVAELLLNGMSPGEVTAYLKAAVEDPASAQMTQPEADMLAQQLPATTDQFGNTQGFDWNAVGSRITELAMPLYEETAATRAPGVEIDELGRAFSTSEKASPMMEELQRLGLPDPRQQYDESFLLANDPSYGLMQQTRSREEQEMEEAQQAYARYLSDVDKRDRNLAQDARRMEGYNERMDTFGAQAQGAMSDYFRAVASGAVSNEDVRGRRPVEGNAEMIEMMLPDQPNRPRLSLYSEPIDTRPREQRGRALTPAQRRANEMVADIRENDFGLSRSRNPAPLPTGRQARNTLNQQRRQLADARFRAAMQEIPMRVLQQAGRRPFTDAIQQRMQPLYASGGAGQIQMPWRYPQG